MAPIAKALTRINDGVLSVCRMMAVAFLASMTFVILLQVFFRYVLNSPLAWPEEAARYMMVWMTFLIAPVAYRQGLIVRMESVVDRLPHALRSVLEIATNVLVLLLAIVLCREAFWMMGKGAQMTSTATGLRMSWVFSILPVSFVLIISIGLERMFARLNGGDSD